MISKSAEGWSIIGDDHSRWSHSDLIRQIGRIDIDLADLNSQEYIKPYLVPGTTAIDVGAHLGCFTISMMRCLGPKGFVLAYEPDPELHECLWANIEKEVRENPESAIANAQRTAVGAYCGSTLFHRNPENYGAGQVDLSGRAQPSKEWERIDMVTLDSAADIFKAKRLCFIKIDCEGSEIDVIRGAQELIWRYRPVMFIEVNQWAFEARQITQATLEEELMAHRYRFEFFPVEWVRAGKAPHDLLALPT